MNGISKRRRYRLRVELLEDLHSGTGTGEAAIDAVQKRDRRGLPVIRATHLKGVLRQAAEELASIDRGLQDRVPGLFGHKYQSEPNRRGALMFESIYLSSWGRAGRPVVWSSTARQPGQRAPMTKTLRSREFVPAGSVFSGHILLRDETLGEVLEDCVHRMDALGAERRRGGGLVHVELKSLPERPTEPVFPVDQEGPVRLRLVLRNLDPLCLPVTGYPGNIIPTECYIRGQAMLGALADWARDRGADPSLLFRHGRGDVRIGNAYPLPEEIPAGSGSIRSWELIPMPLQLKAPKPTSNDAGDWPWWAHPERGGKCLDPGAIHDDLNPPQEKPAEKPKRPKDGEFLFRLGDEAPWARYSPPIQVHLRTQVRDRRGGEDEGELFSVFEIAEETRFLAEMDFIDRTTAEVFARAFSPVLQDGDWLAVGRGGRPVMVEECCWMPVSLQQYRSGSEKGPASFSLLLESDLLARSTRKLPRDGKAVRLPNLGYHETLDPHMLIELAEFPEDHGLEVEKWDWKSVCDCVDVRGYNAATRLQRAPARAVRRGSAIRIEGPDAGELFNELRKRSYLGLRGREGFGRFRLFTGSFPMPNPVTPGPEDAVSEDSGAEIARAERERLLAEGITLAEQILRNGKNNPLPSRAQWMDLRTRIRAASEIDQALADLGERTGTLSGRSWEFVLEDIRAKAREIQGRDQDPRLFLDCMIRWLLSRQEMRRKR